MGDWAGRKSDARGGGVVLLPGQRCAGCHFEMCDASDVIVIDGVFYHRWCVGVSVEMVEGWMDRATGLD
ncbi:MAG: hypothetical protein GF320_21930 [Armatimonadia bacterium]|nr:hypothetical protein [Armatimonadia bacterium]